MILFLSPQEELVGDYTIAERNIVLSVIKMRACSSAQVGEETGGHAGC